MKKIILILLPLFFIQLISFAQLPSITLKDINGKSIDIASLSQQEKPIILSFFATWCEPCIRELNAIQQVYKDWQKEVNVEVIVISIDQGQDVAKVKPMADGYGWDFPVLLDSNHELRKQMKVNSVPRNFIINPQGEIVFTHSGYREGGEEMLIEEVRKAVGL